MVGMAWWYWIPTAVYLAGWLTLMAFNRRHHKQRMADMDELHAFTIRILKDAEARTASIRDVALRFADAIADNPLGHDAEIVDLASGWRAASEMAKVLEQFRGDSPTPSPRKEN
jgi:hypothetical protein